MYKTPVLPITLSILSVLSITACGGGGDASFTGDAKPSFLGDLNQPLDPLNIPPTSVDTFLVNQSIESTEPGGLRNQGQQNSPTVASLDIDNNNKVTAYDEVRFDQLGVVGEICAWDGNETDPQCWDNGHLLRLQTAISNAEAAQAKAATELEQAQAALDSLPATATRNQIAEAQAAVTEAERTLQQARNDLAQARFEFTTPGPTGPISQRIPPDGVVVMRDVNGLMHTIGYSGTIDRGFLKSVQVEKLISSPDAGISKIERIRVRDKDGNATLKPYYRPLSREFTEVIVFDRNFVPGDSGKVVPEEVQYLDVYFRNPAASGWSYQTFGNFKSQYLHDRRNLLVGYQSIGKPTDNSYDVADRLPDQKFAEYRGISHAYINSDKQVTMHNYIKADFRNRKLDYKTLDEAILHTFEGPNKTHVIEIRPDLNVSGSASWDKGDPRFVGTVRTAGGLQGKMDGQFYGPRAAEIGGVYGMEGAIDGVDSHYVGGFGAKRK